MSHEYTTTPYPPRFVLSRKASSFLQSINSPHFPPSILFQVLKYCSASLFAMRSQISSALLGLTTATAVLAQVSYDGAKAMRIPTGEDVTPVLDIVNKLSLATWKGMANGVPVPNSHVDLVVPADKIDDFNQLVEGMTTEVMHEDLGASIAEEGNFAPYTREL